MTWSEILTIARRSSLVKKAIDFLVSIREMDLKRVTGIYQNDSGPPIGSALLMYITAPFFMDEDDPRMGTHINRRNALMIVRVLNDIGYCVDIVDFNDHRFDTKKTYDIIIGVGKAFDYGKDYFRRSRIKIYYATGYDWLTETYLMYQRALALQKKKGVTILPRRLNQPYFSPEKCDVIFSVQNSYTNESYLHLNKPVFYLPPSSSFDFPSSDKSVRQRNTKSFLWLSGGGMVLKGLDIVLEAFAQMPDFQLHVCAEIRSEPEFERLYSKELFETPNIKTEGFLDIGSKEFHDIASSCVGIIYPYPEGEISGSILNAMYFGLIPIISYFSNEEIRSFGEHTEPTIQGIKDSVKRFGDLTDQQISEKSRKAIEYLKKHHSQAKEYEAWKAALTDVVRKWRSTSH